MKNIILAGIAGGVILMIWSSLAWMALPLHTGSMRTMAHEDTVMAAMQQGMDRKSVYAFPAMPERVAGQSDAQHQEAMDAWTRKYEKGPVGMVIYDPAGSGMVMTGQFIVGFIIAVLSSMLVAWFLSRSTAASSTYLARVAFCGMLGIFASLVSHVTYWNWMGYPADYTSAMVVDVVLGWLLAGLGIAALIKTRPVVAP